MSLMHVYAAVKMFLSTEGVNQKTLYTYFLWANILQCACWCHDGERPRNLWEHEGGSRDGVDVAIWDGSCVLSGRSAADTPAAADHTGAKPQDKVAAGKKAIGVHE